jgi:hypothetical protein
MGGRNDGRGHRFLARALSAAAALGLTGCGEEPAGPSAVSEDLEVLAAMEEAIQDEYRAELIYLKVVDDFGEVRPFSNILFAEERHSDALARLFAARGIPVPASQWAPVEIPGFPSVGDACAAGVQAEISNAEIYERHFSLDLPDDVLIVFESNRAASLHNHLPAFERCS